MSSKPPYLFEDLRSIFRQGDFDPVRRFLHVINARDRSGRPRTDIVPIEFGAPISDRELTIRPINEPRTFTGYELTEAIIARYNEDYWLLALWNALARNAHDSTLAIDLVRAFIKHGVFLTGEELLKSERKVIDALFVKRNGLGRDVEYYNQLFAWSPIFNCLHLSARKEVVRRLRRDRSVLRLSRLRRVTRDEALARLPEINEVLGYAKLPPLKLEAKEHTANILPITRVLFLNAHFWRRQRELREALAEILGIDKPFSLLR
jgi:hypothetical protein